MNVNEDATIGGDPRTTLQLHDAETEIKYENQSEDEDDEVNTSRGPIIESQMAEASGHVTSHSQMIEEVDRIDDEDEKISFVNVELDHSKIESEFKSVLDEISEDPAMTSFRVEYAKIHSALLESHENERRIMNKCRQLQIKVASSSGQLISALKNADDAQQTISNYKQEVEKAWRMVDIANERDQEAKDTMEALQKEINRLRQAASKEDPSSSDKQSALEKLKGTRDTLTDEKDILTKQISELKVQLEEVTHKCEMAEKSNEEMQTKLENLSTDLQLHKNDLFRETRRKERAEREIINIRRDIEAKEAELKIYNEHLEQGRTNLTEVENLLMDQRTVNEKLVKDLEALNSRYQKLQLDYESQLAYGNRFMQENQAKTTEMKHREEQLASLRIELGRMSRHRDNLQKMLKTTEDKKQELEEQISTSNALTLRLKKELETHEKQIESDKKAFENMRHEKESLKKDILDAQAVSAKQLSIMKLHVKARRVLENETQQLQQANMEEKIVIGRLEKERERCINDSAELKQKMLDLIEEQKTKDLEISDFKKRIDEAETKLKQKQTQFEAVSKEKDLYRKNLLESQNAVSEMNKKMQITNHQIDRLKEENASRETSLMKEQFEKQRILKEKTSIMQELDDLKTQSSDMKKQIAMFDSEITILNKIISENETENEKLKKDVLQAMTERDVLGTQLVRCNSEISLLYEKIRIQQSLLSKGHQHYNKRIEDIELLKTEIRKLRRELDLQGRTVHTLDDMRREMYSLHKELLQERFKCKALEEELSRPQNVHRWRRLEGNDPEQYELIIKIQALQRRLIAKMEEIAKRESDIQEKDKLYLELKKSLTRQPGPQASDQLFKCRASIEEKTRQIKSLSAEMHMYESHIEKHQTENAALKEELNKLRREFLLQKKKLARSAQRNQVQIHM